MQLNAQQQAIVLHPFDRSLLGTAGPGSGKTQVILRRTVALAEYLPLTHHIQMLTFSNKAAQEMLARLKKVAGPEVMERVRCDTYHSWGLKRIKDDPAGFGLESGFSLLSAGDVRRSIRALAKQCGLAKNLSKDDIRRLNPSNWLSTWSLARQAGFDVLNPSNKGVLIEKLIKAHNLQPGEEIMVWGTLSGYEAEKRQANSVDFDDLLFLPLLRLARDQEYAARIRTDVGHVVLDESQDTNRIQYEIVRLWICGHCAATMVGDDDQSIYGWRGAEVSNLRRFKNHFGADELRLEQNYRSTRAIVDSATALIRNNPDRLEKTPFSDGPVGEVPQLHCYDDSYGMARSICDRVLSLIEGGAHASEIAVLYRTNRMAMVVEGELRRRGVDYHVVGGMSLFDRSEVVAVSSAIRLAYNPRDTYALKTLINFIDGVGPGVGALIQEWLESTPNASLHRIPESLPGVSAPRLHAVRKFITDLNMEAATANGPEGFIDWVMKGPMRLLDRETDDDVKARKEQFLGALAKDIEDELKDRKQLDTAARWQDVLLDAALRESRQSESSSGQVTLITIHRSKGLEWDHVLIAGLSNGLMPLEPRGLEENDDEAGYMHLNEERRLAFVASTRPRKTCDAFHADSYRFPGSNQEQTFSPSSFADELCCRVTDHRFNGGQHQQFEMNESSVETTHDLDGFVERLRNSFPRV